MSAVRNESADRKRVMPWIIAVGLFMENLDATIINTAVPTMAASLQVEPLSLKAVLTSYTLSLAVFIPVSGWMADRFGTRRVFSNAIALFTLGSLLCGCAVNTPMLVASRIVQGMGGAMMMPVGRLALVRAFPRSEMIATMNFVVIPALIGPLVGPFAGGLIVHWLPWRVIFFVNIPIGLAGLWFARRYMADFRDPDARPLDSIGFVLFGAGIATLSYVLEVFGEHTWAPSSLLALTGLSLLLLATYGLHARKTGEPLLALSLFRTRTFSISVLGGFVTRLGVGGMPFLLPLLYQVGLGYPPWQAGLFTMPQAFAAIGMKIISRTILARLGHRAVLAANTVLLGGNIMAFALVGPATPVWCILSLAFMQGFFSSLQFTSMNSLTYADVADEDASKGSSIASTAQQLSLSFGIATASLVAGVFIGGVSAADRAPYVDGLHHAFLAIGAFTVLSSLAFRRLRPGDGINVSNYRPREPKKNRG
ncbi:DHA2 family efflux MFS transporter permease subunit [Termitidicoccus mucosus]|uniref:EmrB/QacA family drug resistance transporter n=1 Tax=Termitidicoccus mucosus TaxID=1184151 RepID=A0A178IKG3_9BACT|nr:EmrB/QacA family drug resistance transporter [Opitutaceae bacterium TSB47]